MNESELDEVLNRWEAPEAPVSLRRNMLAAVAGNASGRRFGWLAGFLPRVLATGLAGFGLLAFIVSRATPQTGRVPYTVESEVSQFFNDGSSHSANITSYNRDGSEVFLSMYKPDSLFGTLLGQLARTVHGTTLPGPEREGVNRADMAEVIWACAGHGCLLANSWFFVPRQQLLQSRCEAEGLVVGHESILGYPTVAVTVSIGGGARKRKMTLWRAPGLGCFALRAKMEALDGGGRYFTTDLKQALKVAVSR